MTDRDYLKNLRVPTVENPLRILFSSCLLGVRCGADGSSYGTYEHIKRLSELKNIKICSFCPEDFAFGTPRQIPDIEGGTGADVLDGKATVISETGEDLTEGMVSAAHEMVRLAIKNCIELAVMMDISAACGSQVIYKGHRLSNDPQYQIGMGVSAELLQRNGFKVISQRDYYSLEILLSRLDPQHEIDIAAKDHDQTDWYKSYFK